MSPSVSGHSAAPISNITNLYNALLKASVVSASATPTSVGETAKVDQIVVKCKGRTDGHQPLNANAAAAIAKRDAELRALYIVVPSGDEASPHRICEETIKSEFLEDDEDLVWMNMTKKDN
ncbi:hypothetical protein PILCRDRAFT_11358 [Piloderma croceum F 1598]|uniref:Uncharacterized protein n=1 Tax=Piloderma croceum (strain F 1598) TaxID=765440 RepID=A0A0C3AWK1_PILCF|nr:hypothetical protein PILCRDRAFT_11358 [Piloderma croceum F 1598]